jgi:pyruvate formate lyase activating enzyme
MPCSHPECKALGRCIHICPQGRLNICGKEMDSAELACKVKRQAAFLIENNGGVTLSGGEPLSQPKFLFTLMGELKPMHLAVETSGYASKHVFRKMMDLADLILIDIKHMNNSLHRKYTGVGNGRILSNVDQLKQGDKPFIIRIPLIPGVNDDTPNLQATAEFLTGAKNLIRIELMPYNVLAGAKYRAVGLEYQPGFNVNAQPHIDRQPFISRGIDSTVL